MREELRRRIGEELWARMDIECEQVGRPFRRPSTARFTALLEQVMRDHDAGAVPLPFLAPFATDAKHLARIGVPTYGFSPLKTGRDDGLLDADARRRRARQRRGAAVRPAGALGRSHPASAPDPASGGPDRPAS